MHPHKTKRAYLGPLGRIRSAGAFLGLAMGAMTLTVGSPVALAQSRPAIVSPSDGSSTAETQKLERDVIQLQQKLEAINIEVKALKQGPRNLSSDYRLRQKLADAESLGRKLTDAEARLRARQGGRPRGFTAAAPSPQANATDGPVELAAKADILLDQAQKLVAQADRLEHRGTRERTRSTLRARARHLEQDPFVGLESSKRNIAFSRSSVTKTNNPVPLRDDAEASSTTADDFAAPPPTVGPASAPEAEGASQGGGTLSGGRNSPEPVALPGDTSTGSVSLGFRALLDAGTLAQIERIERSGDPRARAHALEAAVSALRKRAAELQAQAKALRAQP